MSDYSRSKSPNTGQQRNVPTVATRLAELHVSGDYSDFTLRCDFHEFKVHKAIVCPQSGFLKRLCDPKFKEGQEGQAELKEVDPILLQQAIQFLYTGRYADPSAATAATNTHNQGDTVNDKATGRLTLSESALPGNESDATDEPAARGATEITVSPADPSNTIEQEDHPGLLLHIRMYILADYLEIPSLKTDALDKCTAILQTDFEPARIIGPLQFALENTTGSDQELRSTIFQLCSDQRAKVVNDGKLDELLAREEPIAWRLLKEQHVKHCEAMEKSDLEGSRLAAEILTLELQLRDMRHELEGAENAIHRKEDQLDDCIKLTQKWVTCRNCAVDFDVELERHRHTGDYFLRCRRCRCRHEEY